MRYFEIHDPYYSLIQAKNINNARTIYNDEVASEEDEENFEIKEVQSDYAIASYARGLSEDLKEIPIPEILSDLRSGKEMILLIDGSLL